ncbi:gluconate 2-dehydrogenase subunit 3 family protein [Lederbergia wuyishanensis]|uniref:Gluconate 2-dehydrogenase gamma chain n=1 Tax=Lederbergia wuyishanensis TaxID=1347903 RepID=A0ABU0D8A7_9BACI|nr:gluconate 2-dehydrogenase subunit 3 family protein [Lederbergia wuyishanensis]MCJ8009213.1 gluconate 2-dehydrogenase subunit 3 family protein [Lederbergia wuyishanensis]MDQ0344657.1 gluconate 2-dehydrogenase gamma chain [Lederbergia wuyishanensis]
MSEQKGNKQMTRREFIRKGSYVAGGAIGGGVLGGLITQQVMKPNIVNQGAAPPEKGEAQRFTQAMMYFSNPEDFNVLSAASERIFPADDLGPGAIDLDVPYYIDHQLAGAWGHNARDYMMGPFFPGLETQGFQSHLKRNEIFSQGIGKIKSYSQQKYNKRFTELSEKEQDEVLISFEKGDVPMEGVTSNDFFTLLRMAVLEGVYADPLYGGNRDMGGWKMKGFPGNQMSYLDKIEATDFLVIEPVSLHAHMPSHGK